MLKTSAGFGSLATTAYGVASGGAGVRALKDPGLTLVTGLKVATFEFATGAFQLKNGVPGALEGGRSLLDVLRGAIDSLRSYFSRPESPSTEGDGSDYSHEGRRSPSYSSNDLGSSDD